ncbi:S41 family peptidase [Flavobacteriaceae bacterium M23B6Z8]
MEIYDQRSSFIQSWYRTSHKNVKADTQSFSGKYAIKIKGDKRTENRFFQVLPGLKEGGKIRLTSQVKVTSATNATPELFLKLEDSNAYTLNFEKKILNNFLPNEWYSISLEAEIPKETECIVFGGSFTGDSDVIFDDFSIQINDTPVEKSNTAFKSISRVYVDREFDYGTNLNIPKNDRFLRKKLALLCKVWGYLKYHHPGITNGEYHWDYELFRILPSVFEASTESENMEILTSWIRSFPIIKDLKTTEKTPLKELFWLKDPSIPDEIKKLFKEVYTFKRKDIQFYVKSSSIGYAEFTNEKAYFEHPYPDIGFRILSLFRYWNIIAYFYPYKNIIGTDWNEIMDTHIYNFLKAQNELDYELAVLRLVESINDNHANLRVGANKIKELRGSFVPSFKVRFIENELVVTENYKIKDSIKFDLLRGSVITHINNISIKVLVDSLLPFYPAANMASKLRDISDDILRSRTNTTEVTFKYKNTSKQAVIPLYDEGDISIPKWYEKDSKQSFKLLTPEIGYVTLRSITPKDVNLIKTEFLNTKGIIIDVRNYPSTFVPFTLGSFFVSSSIPFVKFSIPDISNPGTFYFSEPLEVPHGEKIYTGEVVVLINEYTQSQAEYTVMAFKASELSILIGSQTAGTNGNVTSIILPGGLRTSISGIGVYDPNEKTTQRSGIQPDIYVKPSIKGIEQGRDEILEVAIKYLTSSN